MFPFDLICLTVCYGLNCGPSSLPPANTYTEVLNSPTPIPEAQHKALFGKRVMEDEISGVPMWQGEPSSHMTDVFIRRENLEAHGVKMKAERGGDASASQGPLKVASKPPVAEGEAWNRFSLTSLRRS